MMTSTESSSKWTWKDYIENVLLKSKLAISAAIITIDFRILAISDKFQINDQEFKSINEMFKKEPTFSMQNSVTIDEKTFIVLRNNSHSLFAKDSHFHGLLVVSTFKTKILAIIDTKMTQFGECMMALETISTALRDLGY